MGDATVRLAHIVFFVTWAILAFVGLFALVMAFLSRNDPESAMGWPVVFLGGILFSVSGALGAVGHALCLDHKSMGRWLILGSCLLPIWVLVLLLPQAFHQESPGYIGFLLTIAALLAMSLGVGFFGRIS